MNFLTVCTALLVVGVGGQDAGKKLKPIPGVEVVLRISVNELDPLNPGDSFLECVVRNGSERELTVPVGLAGGFDPDLALWGGAVHLVYWAAPKTQDTTKVKPGAEAIAFKAKLKDVLLLDFDAADKPLMPKKERYYWTWSR